MALISVFDVLGPNMIGPSSSHTAGACSMAYLAQKIFGEPIKEVEFTLYGSFATTYRGHGTDRALLGGVMGFATDDARIRDSFEIAEEKGIKFSFVENHEDDEVHPNTADIRMVGETGREMMIRGESIGGGKCQIVMINGIKVTFTGEYPTLIVVQKDVPGVVAHITHCLANRCINVAFLSLFRESKNLTAYTIVESDQHLPEEIRAEVMENENVIDTMIVEP